MTNNVHPIRTSLQPVDRLKRPLRDLRISVMDRCNFRCLYCMPKDAYHDEYRFLESGQRLSFHEIVRLSRLFAGLGVRKLRLTGGEPLLRTNLGDLIGDLSSINGIEDIALTTNGVLLRQHAADLYANGLRRVTVSLDALDRRVFERMNGGFVALDEVLEGIEAAIAAGLTPVKINTVVIRGLNDHMVLDLIERFRGRPAIVRFVEFMDVGNRNAWRPDMVVPSREIVARVNARWPIRPLSENYRGEVAKRWAFADGAGEIGFVSSVSQPFCSGCNRARLSSEGRLYTCLFATEGLDLRAALRRGVDDTDLLRMISETWNFRSDRYSELRGRLRREESEHRRIEMYYIGG